MALQRGTFHCMWLKPHEVPLSRKNVSLDFFLSIVVENTWTYYYGKNNEPDVWRHVFGRIEYIFHMFLYTAVM